MAVGLFPQEICKSNDGAKKRVAANRLTEKLTIAPEIRTKSIACDLPKL
jgi:hypothetical protein